MPSVRDPPLYITVAVMFCGVADVPAGLAVPLGVVGLQAMSLPRYLRLFGSAHAAGAARRWWRAVGLSLSFAIIAAGGAFVIGQVIAMLLSGSGPG